MEYDQKKTPQAINRAILRHLSYLMSKVPNVFHYISLTKETRTDVNVDMFGEELLIISFEHQFPIRIGDFSPN
jgi:hypothetical protein